ncbi:hypothetical protein H0E87_015057 [Populus deltoides]|uniref:Bet v I/Major latex protein domain-containing protein n=1 Tax=Populus deltoides TaxID=3696 RepID=A0A8T2Y3H3_POPDE|nr:hypothetical protein H0E87_015057 [Populus deltoides]
MEALEPSSKLILAMAAYLSRRGTDAIDKDNLSYAYTVFEGDALANTYEKIFNESKIGSLPDGGSVCKTSTTYYTVGNVDAKADEIKDGQRKANGIIQGH